MMPDMRCGTSIEHKYESIDTLVMTKAAASRVACEVAEAPCIRVHVEAVKGMAVSISIERTDKPFVVKAPYQPSGDQPQAIEELAERINDGENDVVLMGATGTGKTATVAWLIEKLQRPTLILEPNKTLAACATPPRRICSRGATAW